MIGKALPMLLAACGAFAMLALAAPHPAEAEGRRALRAVDRSAKAGPAPRRIAESRSRPVLARQRTVVRRSVNVTRGRPIARQTVAVRNVTRGPRVAGFVQRGGGQLAASSIPGQGAFGAPVSSVNGLSINDHAFRTGDFFARQQSQSGH